MTVVVTGAVEAGQGQVGTQLAGVLTLPRVRAVIPGTRGLANTARVFRAGVHLSRQLGLPSAVGDDLARLRAHYGVRPDQEDRYKGDHRAEELTHEHEGEELQQSLP